MMRELARVDVMQMHGEFFELQGRTQVDANVSYRGLGWLPSR
jgi:hypothetical protein